MNESVRIKLSESDQWIEVTQDQIEHYYWLTLNTIQATPLKAEIKANKEKYTNLKNYFSFFNSLLKK